MSFARTFRIATAVIVTSAVVSGAAWAQTSPVISARIAAANVVVDHHAAVQGRMMRCVAARDARHGELAVADWRGQVGRAHEVLAKAGIAFAERWIILARITPETLLVPTGSAEEERAACAANDDWERRWDLFMAATFAPDLREALTGTR